MTASQDIAALPAMSTDERVRVFRRVFSAEGEFEGMEVDAYVVITNRYVVVLDTLLRPEDMAFVMNAVRTDLAGRQLLVVNSHADWDHSWGNSYFTGKRAAPIIAHDYCLTRLQAVDAQEELLAYQQRYSEFQNVVITPPTVTFSHTLTIHGGDLSIHLLPAPGHHLDHIAAWIPQLRLLLAFDAVEKPVPLIENAAGVELMRATWQRFLALQPEHVLCSHGKTTSLAMVERNLAYLNEIAQRGRSLLATHQPTQEELNHASTLIHYPFDETLADPAEPVDRTFYAWAHENNVRYVLEALMASQG